MNASVGYDRKRTLFFWGMVLVGTSSIPFLVMFFNAFRGMSREKATGLAAVAGGLTEAYATLGFILSLVLPVVAIVLLARSLSGAGRTRKVFSSLLIVWSSFVLLLWGLGGWFFLIQMPRLISSHQ
jgi:hypothetical protein